LVLNDEVIKLKKGGNIILKWAFFK
jgi:hypothetical protein